jgi:hypothetical protein
MFHDVLDEGSATLHLKTQIAHGVHQSGLLTVLLMVLRAWWHRPRIPAHLTARERADMGLPPARPGLFSVEKLEGYQTPLPFWKPGL